MNQYLKKTSLLYNQMYKNFMDDEKINPVLAKSLLFNMYKIRQVELKIADLYAEQEMRCPVHLSVGQEAVAVGVCNQLANTDIILSAHDLMLIT